MDIQTRLKVYEDMLNRFTTHNMNSSSCLCGLLINSVHFSFDNKLSKSIFNYPELYEQKPATFKPPYESLYWWPLSDKESRIIALNNAINFCKQQIKNL